MHDRFPTSVHTPHRYVRQALARAGLALPVPPIADPVRGPPVVPRGRSRRAMRSGLRVKDLCVVLVNPDVVADRGLIGEIELVEADVTIQRIEHVEPFPGASRPIWGTSVSTRRRHPQRAVSSSTSACTVARSLATVWVRSARSKRSARCAGSAGRIPMACSTASGNFAG